MKYGTLPTSLGIHKLECTEMLAYLYLPIKMAGLTSGTIEKRITRQFSALIQSSMDDYVKVYGLQSWIDSYVYITAKHLYSQPGCDANRPGWHSDGFLTDDINYIWCNNYPTVFNTSDFSLTPEHELSLLEMDMQAYPSNNIRYHPYELLRLDQYNIHRVPEITKPCMRTFFKMSVSKDRYNLIGNSHNYLLNYDWEMKQREETRNQPSK